MSQQAQQPGFRLPQDPLRYLDDEEEVPDEEVPVEEPAPTNGTRNSTSRLQVIIVAVLSLLLMAACFLFYTLSRPNVNNGSNDVTSAPAATAPAAAQPVLISPSYSVKVGDTVHLIDACGAEHLYVVSQLVSGEVQEITVGEGTCARTFQFYNTP